MELNKIKQLNQKIYELDTTISGDNKVIFIASLIFCLNAHNDFPSKLTSYVNFSGKNPINQIIKIAEDYITDLNTNGKVNDDILNAVKDSLKNISGTNTHLCDDTNALKDFIEYFLKEFSLVNLKGEPFFEMLYKEIDKKAKGKNKGIVLTPEFTVKTMIDIANLDYKKDIVTDLCCGTGIFGYLAYSKMLEDLNKDSANLTFDEKQKYEKRLRHSIIANDIDPKMATLTLANFLINNLNTELLFCEDIQNLKLADFKIKLEDGTEEELQPTKGFLNPPYEDKFQPVSIVLNNIKLLKAENKTDDNNLVVIMPISKYGQKPDDFKSILSNSNLDCAVKMQTDLFIESGTGNLLTYILKFNTNREHKKSDIAYYYDFSNAGYEYAKDSGLVDKQNKHLELKENLLNKIKNKTTNQSNSLIRDFSNFYDIQTEQETQISIDPDNFDIDKSEADICYENILTKKVLSEKNNLISSCNNEYDDNDLQLENYIIDVLSED